MYTTQAEAQDVITDDLVEPEKKKERKTFFREIISPPFPHFNSDMSSFGEEFPSLFFTSCRQSFFFFCFHRQTPAE
jgi:hypothetical protein